MPRQIRKIVVAGMFFITVALAGCLPPDQTAAPPPVEMPAVPPHVAGTVGEYAALIGGTPLVVRGYGLVAGLGQNGSSEVPSRIREYMVQVLLRTKTLSTESGGNVLSPSTILADRDTSVVELMGRIPPGAPEGTRFDVSVSVPPQVQTHSLDGGVMFLPADMHLAVTREMASKRSRVFAVVDGTIFVNPFLDPAKTEDLPRLREGRIIGGGKVVEARPLRLFLYRPDYQQARLIERRINERFGGGEVAKARDNSTLTLTIPDAYAPRYERFLRLLMHIPIRQTGGSWETKAREIASAMETTGANHDELALVWEAMGRQALPFVKPLYDSANPVVAFYAARTGLRLGDAQAATIVAKTAGMSGSPLQMIAIEELGYHRLSTQTTPILRELLDDDNELVRLAACDALLRQGDSARIRRMAIKDQFDVDLVSSAGEPMIYVSQSLRQRIVIFANGELLLRRPMFFRAPEDLVTIMGPEGEDTLTVFRKIPSTGQSSKAFKIEPTVRELVRLLGTLPVQTAPSDIYGLGLTYSQVVGVLHRLCRTGDIPAGFRLQVLPEVSRIYSRSATSVGRPDMPEGADAAP